MTLETVSEVRAHGGVWSVYRHHSRETQPNQELAEAAGLACDNGVVVDLAARTSDPAVYAIGDCTRRPLPLSGTVARLERVPNPLEQAKQAVADLCGTNHQRRRRRGSGPISSTRSFRSRAYCSAPRRR